MFNVEDTTFSLDQEVADSFKGDILVIVASQIKKELTSTVIESLTPQNFLGEASEYLKDHSLDASDENLEIYSIRICQEFKANVDSLVQVTPDAIQVHPAVMELEFGSYYKPLLKLITKSIELSLKDLL